MYLYKKKMDNTIAVLPFVNMSPDPDNEYFSDGMTEEIINALASIDNLKVTSRTSSFFFKNKNIPLKQVADQLGVSVILEGSVRLANNMLRISAQLIEADQDIHFWSETWDRKLENIFEIQDEISLLIADKLREQFGHLEIRDHLVERQTENLDAYAYSLKAKHHFNKWNPTDVSIALELFQKSLALDPSHTESYVGLADAYGFMATTEFMPRTEAWQKAAECTYKALSLNPQNAGAHYQLANLSFFTDFNFEDAMKHAVKSIELKPNYPEAQQFMAFLHILTGEMPAALKHLQLAININPLSHETLFYKAYYDYRNGKYSEAMVQLDECLATNPKNLPAYIVKCYCLLMLEKYEQVIDYLDSLPAEIIVPDEHLGIKCLAYIRKGDRKNDRIHVDLLENEAKSPLSFQAHSYLFLAYANLHKHDKAFDWLEETIKMKSSILLLSYTDPLVNGLSDDPRYMKFKKLLYRQQNGFVLPKTTKEPLMDAKTAEMMKKDVITYINQEKPFLTPNLSLRALADQIQTHPNKLSWLLNEHMGKNFNDFINHYRVEYFKNLATDPSNAHISLIGLAFESGFNSKTAFNTFFKKEVGMTPVEFLKKNGS